MKIVEWNNQYSINVRQIDKQHEKLFSMLNSLGELVNNRSDFSYILRSLNNYADVHFATEEKYFDQYNYPHTYIHKKEHANFKQKVLDFFEVYLNEEREVSEEIIVFLKNWLENHINVEDKKLGPFLNEKGIY